MKIAVVAVGTRGDVEPHAALCQGLRDAGFDARLCAPNDEALSYKRSNLPFDAIPISFRRLCQTESGSALLATGRSGLDLLRELRQAGAEVAAQVVASIRVACTGADAVIYSPLGLPALFFAREMGIPAVPTGLQPLGRTGEYASPLFALPRSAPGFLNKLSYRVVEHVYWRAIRPLIRPHLVTAIPSRSHFNDLYAGKTPLLFGYSPHVVPRPGDWKPWMHATGYWTIQPESWEPPADLARFLAAGPAICVGFGSMQGPGLKRTVETAVEMLARTGRHAIVLTGWHGNAFRRTDLPDNIFVTDAVPHAWLFSRVTAVVHHGGAGTTGAALRAGCPSIIVPVFFDQGFWGSWLAARGLGPAPIKPSRFSAATLESALNVIERSPQMTARLQQLSSLLQKEDGVRKAVAIISDALERKPRAHLER